MAILSCGYDPGGKYPGNNKIRFNLVDTQSVIFGWSIPRWGHSMDGRFGAK